MTQQTDRMGMRLEEIYQAYNKRAYVDPDPLVYLYDYPDKRNREIAGLIAACFAYGQVLQIMKTVGHILEKMNPSPYQYLMERAEADMHHDFKGFRYRFAGEADLVGLLMGIQGVLTRFSSLENCFCTGLSEMQSDDYNSVQPGLVFFCGQLDPKKSIGHLLADPEKKSACKRSHLFLRWMVRADRVDPGGWDQVAPSGLIVPIDLHMHRIGQLLKFTGRKSADLKTALEITQGFAQIVPHDPVRYDFCLTRYGIRNEMNMEDLKEKVYN